jgi:uncharacterized protein YbjT (DUF2867 family)
MTSSILVTGGTGTLGRHLVPRLRATGRRVRVLSRTAHPASDGVDYVVGNLETGTGLAEAVDGVETILHGAGSAKRDGRKAENLVRALGSSSTARHLVYISVVGADTTPFESAIDRSTLGYFDEKRRGELLIEASGIPFTILRATQFHDFFAAFTRLGLKLPIIPSFAGFRYQPVDARDVAERLVELALADPAGVVPDLGGPTIYPMEDVIRDYLRATGHRRPVLPMHIPGAAARAQRAGANLTPERAMGARTWEQYLSDLRA